MPKLKEQIYKVDIFGPGENIVNTEYISHNPQSGIFVSEALRKAVFELHPEATYYSPEVISKRQLKRELSEIKFEKFVIGSIGAIIALNEVDQQALIFEDINWPDITEESAWPK